jgi:hypothetical protein
MSGAPTSEDERPDPRALLAAGWSEQDLAWERAQAEAARRDAQGEAVEAARLWAEALRIARTHFSRDDLRLATSLANQAAAMRRAGKTELADRLFDEALLVWDSGGRWLARLRPERRARSSLFHLRLESKHPGGYARHSRERYDALAREGRAAILDLRAGRDAARETCERWTRERPQGFTDGRKLLAAAVLIARG